MELVNCSLIVILGKTLMQVHQIIFMCAILQILGTHMSEFQTTP
jgi:Ni/Fe-hydrogenase subunit HybB-like protein